MSTHRRQPRVSRAAATGSSRESGSAYVLTLIVLLVLTLLGLVLALITQSEVEVGANERTINRAFYSAEIGLTASVANYLYNNSRAPVDVTLMDPSSATFGAHVQVSPMLQINVGPCNMCEINQGGDFYNITSSLQSQAERFGVAYGGEETALSAKNIKMMVAIQPTQDNPDLENFDPDRP